MDEIGKRKPDRGRRARKNRRTPLKDEAGKFKESKEYQNKLVDLISEKEELPVLDFRLLAKMNILRLQFDLEKLHKDVQSFVSGPVVDLDRLEAILHKYTTALRDYDYMDKLEYATSHPNKEGWMELRTAIPSIYDESGFKWTSELIYKRVAIKELPKGTTASDPLRSALNKIVQKFFSSTSYNMDLDIRGDEHNTIIAFLASLSAVVDRLARFIVAITGGLSLVVPMLIMRLHQNSTGSLVTTSVAVVLFSAVISMGFKTSNAETLGITAAYAAVLVVFVGAST